jgi:hypothetical protein
LDALVDSSTVHGLSTEDQAEVVPFKK